MNIVLFFNFEKDILSWEEIFHDRQVGLIRFDSTVILFKASDVARLTI